MGGPPEVRDAQGRQGGTLKRGLVFGGGGSRGSYELGAWRALEELGERFDFVCGTSIGSVNACLYAQQDYEYAEMLWHTITLDEIMKDGIHFAPSIERMMEQKDQIPAFLKTFWNNKGADISPLKKLLQEGLKEDRFFASPVDYALMTVRFPSLEPVGMYKKDIPRGRLWEWVMASATLYPAFPLSVIDGETYIDGGYYETVPVSLALRSGCEEILSVILTDKRSARKDIYWAHPFTSNVAPCDGLGSVLDFSKEVLYRNETRGYLDVMKKYGRYKGFAYAFDPVSVDGLSREAVRFVKALTILSIPDASVPVPIIKRNIQKLPALDGLVEYTMKEEPSCTDLFLAETELLMKEYSLPDDRVYDLTAVVRNFVQRAASEDGKKKSPFRRAIDSVEKAGRFISGDEAGNMKPDDAVTGAYVSSIADFIR